MDVLNEAPNHGYFYPITIYLKAELLKAYHHMRSDYLPKTCNMTIETNLSIYFIIFELYANDISVEFMNVVSDNDAN